MSDNTKHTSVETAEAINADDLMAKYDKEAAYRRLEGIPAKIVFFICVIWSVVQLYTGLFGAFPSTLQRAPHLSAAMCLVYLLYPATGKGKRSTSVPW